MTAAFSVLEADNRRSAAALLGAFDESNRWFLEKHLEELDGDVLLDCHSVESLDDDAVATLRRFRDRAARQRRRVTFRSLPSRYWAALRSR